MAAPIAVMGATVQPGMPSELFQALISLGGSNGLPAQYNVSRDGRFLINTVPEDSAAPITLLLNWKPTVK